MISQIKSLLRISALGLLLASGAGCAIGPVNGVLVTVNQFAGEFNPANDVAFAKEATGCQHLILGLVSFGTAGAGSIAKQAGIKRIAIIDHSTINVLQIVYSRYCTTVVGE